MSRKDLQIHLIKNGVYYLLIMLTAWGLKYHYSRAGSEELAWILAPTAGLVELVSGVQFENEAHTGFVSQGFRIIIAPACAGINFMIVAFCMAAFGGMHTFKHHGLKLIWLCTNFINAYLLAIFVNTVRIIVSIYSYNAHLHWGWLTAARIHRLEGIVIYFFFLSLFYMIISKVLRRVRAKANFQNSGAAESEILKSTYFSLSSAGLIPFFWYGLITLGVPLINGALKADSARFTEHSLMVLSAGSVVYLSIFFVRLIRSRQK